MIATLVILLLIPASVASGKEHLPIFREMKTNTNLFIYLFIYLIFIYFLNVFVSHSRSWQLNNSCGQLYNARAHHSKETAPKDACLS